MMQNAQNKSRKWLTVKWSVQASKQASKPTHARVQWSHASGARSGTPPKFGNYYNIHCMKALPIRLSKDENTGC